MANYWDNDNPNAPSGGAPAPDVGPNGATAVTAPNGTEYWLNDKPAEDSPQSKAVTAPQDDGTLYGYLTKNKGKTLEQAGVRRNFYDDATNFGIGAMDTASRGFSDEALAGLGYIPQAMGITDPSTYAERLAYHRKLLADSGPAGTAGQLYGAYVTRGPDMLMNVLHGGLYGLGSGEGSEDRHAKADIGGALGGALGGASGKWLLRGADAGIHGAVGGYPWGTLAYNTVKRVVGRVLPSLAGAPAKVTDIVAAGAKRGGAPIAVQSQAQTPIDQLLGTANVHKSEGQPKTLWDYLAQ